MLLSHVLNSDGLAILSNKWFYSTELRVLNTQFVFKLCLFLFPVNWHAARMLSVAIFLALTLTSLRFFLKSLRLWEDYAWACIPFMLPFSTSYRYIFLFNGYYVPHLCITLFAIGVAIRASCEPKRLRLYTGVGCALALVSGLGGVRQALLCYAPLAMASLVVFVRAWLDKTGDAEVSRRLALQSCVLLVSCGIGYLANKWVLAGQFTFFDPSEGKISGSISLSELVDYIFSSALEAWGFVGAPGTEGIDGPFLMAQLALCVMLLFATAYCLVRRRCLPLGHRVFLITLVVAILLNAVAFIMKDAMLTRYLVPIAVLAFLLVPIATCDMRARWPEAPVVPVVACLLVGCICMQTFANGRASVVDFRKKTDRELVADWLVQEGLAQGMATFWNGNVLSELADGRVEVWNFGPEFFRQRQPGPDYLRWLQVKEHVSSNPQGRVFMVASSNELKQPGLSKLPKEPAYATDTLKVYVFDSYDAFCKQVFFPK